ncbi:DUF5302 family protein [Nocardioides aurantiacus]|uniref:DUF5302 domain-containing protein n=1 Tax=Nocardioides aurantiacus TaxID=86796 RepID=A0A3N2CXX7_9ACTN|nr:DUF5302 family protein [Nocardioides aurantiacus]ROR92402.1 hypothetical protein EDD33_3292 [Nocardioides aurantiacus]
MADAKPQDTPSQDEIKAKMREALDRKRGARHPDDRAGSKEKAHGSEVVGGAGPQLHRRKAGGGGS